MTSRTPLDPRLVDVGQLRALVELNFRTFFRPTLDSETGKVRGRPLRSLIVSYGILGLIFIGNSSFFADLRSFALLLFPSAIAVAMLALLPETVESLARRTEILGSKPIGRRTSLLAQWLTLLGLVVLVLSCIGLPSIVATIWTFGTRPIVAAGLFFALVFGGFSIGILWIALLDFFAQRMQLDNLRKTLQTSLMVMLVLLSTCSLIPRLVASGATRRVSFAELEYLRFLPPTWFADLVLGDFDLPSNLERAASLLVFSLGLSALVPWRSSEAQMRMVEQLLQPPELRGDKSWPVRLLELAARLPFASRLGLDPAATGVATLVLSYAARDDRARLRTLPMKLILGILMGVAIYTRDPSMLGVTSNVLGFLILVEGIRSARQCPHPAAAWLFQVSPIEARRVVAGLRVAVLLAHFAFPFALSAGAYFIALRPVDAGALTVAYLFEGILIVSLALGLEPAWPLAEEIRVGSIFGNLAWPVVFGTLGPLRTWLVLDRGHPIIYLASLTAAGLVVGRWTTRRFEVHAGAGRPSRTA